MRYYGEIRHQENPLKCAVEVFWQGHAGYPAGNWRKKQCGYKRGYSVLNGQVVPDVAEGIYCRIHARQVAVGNYPGFGVPEDEEE